MTQQPKLGSGGLIVEVYISATSDQLVAEAATYTTHNKHKRPTSVPSAGLEPAVPTS